MALLSGPGDGRRWAEDEFANIWRRLVVDDKFPVIWDVATKLGVLVALHPWRKVSLFWSHVGHDRFGLGLTFPVTWGLCVWSERFTSRCFSRFWTLSLQKPWGGEKTVAAMALLFAIQAFQRLVRGKLRAWKGEQIGYRSDISFPWSNLQTKKIHKYTQPPAWEFKMTMQ